MEKQLGLQITYVTTNPYPELSRLNATITVALGKPSTTFITSPTIKNALKKVNYANGRDFGKIEIDYTHKEKIIDWRRYYPIPHNKGSPSLDFINKGIAARIESKVEKEARKRFPKAKEVMHWHPSKLREEQLKNRNFSIWEIHQRVSIMRYASALRDKLAKDVRTRRKKRR